MPYLGPTIEDERGSGIDRTRGSGSDEEDEEEDDGRHEAIKEPEKEWSVDWPGAGETPVE